MIFPGAFARVLYPDMQNMDMIYPTMLFDLLPTGVLGIVLAGLIAAMMSSLDSGLNSVSTLLTMDFYEKIKPNSSPEQLMKVGRYFTTIVMIIAVLWAPRIGTFDKLWDYLQQTLAWFSPPVVALFVLGIFSKRVNNKGALASITVGFAITLFLIVNAVRGSAGIELPNFLLVAGYHFIACFIVLYGVSKLTPSPALSKTESTVWTKAEYAKETESLKSIPWYQNYRYLSILLIILLFIILIRYN